ncbi:MAG: CPBP family intramembrane metalloprotease [Bacilli bacterium]|nr:CPBP family intramembrane metalloprotease [Bacilli bacterium]
MKKRSNLILFFAITLAWTWICGFIPVILGITGTPIGTFIFYFGGGAPSVVGLFIVFLTYSRAERRDYFKRCFSLKYMEWKWPLIVFSIFSIISTVCIYIGVNILGYDMPGMDYIHAIIGNPLMVPLVILISLVSGPLNEEFGWRGYALDKLIVRFGFLKASLLLGFIWAIWHLAWYFTPGQAQYNLLQDSLFDALMMVPSLMLLSVFVSFVYIKTKRSILAGALVHMFSNLLGSQLLSPYSSEMSMLIRYVKMIFFIILMLYTIFSKKFKSEVAEQIKYM